MRGQDAARWNKQWMGTLEKEVQQLACARGKDPANRKAALRQGFCENWECTEAKRNAACDGHASAQACHCWRSVLDTTVLCKRVLQLHANVFFRIWGSCA